MIVCAGNPVYDFIETPLARTEGRILSGCSTNAAIVLSALGDEVGLLGCVGGDMWDDFTSQMKKRKIMAHVLPSKETGGFRLIYDEKGDRKLFILGVADPISTFPPQFLSSRLILIGPILDEISFRLIDEVKEKTDAPLFLDPQGFTRRISERIVEKFCPPHMDKIISQFNIVKPNEHEAKIITGFDGREFPFEACETLYSWGADIAIVTIAEAGSVIYDGHEVLRIPAHKTLARDPTGAGDTYAAGFIHAFLQKKSIVECGLFASCVASFWVEDVGPDILFTEAMVETRIASLRKGME